MSGQGPVRWGIAGTGGISKTTVSQMAESQEARAVAVSSRNQATADAFASEFGLSRGYAEYSTLVADPEVEAIYIALPHALHKDAILAALDAGKHVLCEKPMALAAAEIDEIAAHPAAPKLTIAEGFMVRYQPQWEWIEAEIARGALGTVQHVTAFTALQLPPPPPDPQRGTLAGDRSLLLDIGCYSVHLVRTVMGAEPTRVSARIERDASGLENVVTAHFDFDGRSADIMLSNTLARTRRIHVFGTKGNLEVMTPIHIPPGAAARVIVGTPDPEERSFPAVAQYSLQIDDVSRAIRAGRPPRIGLVNALGNAKATDAIIASAALGGDWVEV